MFGTISDLISEPMYNSCIASIDARCMEECYSPAAESHEYGSTVLW